ncbi:MAG TPA: Holliday junction branch migration protein RuvA [Thermomicrobiales bacterium]|nr:Holliday junction branch migration protein RuvA [Thermomicrobiales bacterium]
MIAGLRGRLEAKLGDALLIDVGGVIFRVNTSAATLDDVGGVGEEVRVVTHLFVREDQMTLYGFATADELRLFETLIGVTGVGPRLATAILSHVRLDRLTAAINGEDASLLATVPGVGKKTAARLILELRGKIVPAGPIGGPPATPEDREVLEALRSLGYTTAEAQSAVARLPKESGQAVEERVVAALRELSEI